MYTDLLLVARGEYYSGHEKTASGRGSLVFQIYRVGKGFWKRNAAVCPMCSQHLILEITHQGDNALSITESRVKGIETQLNGIRERVARIDGLLEAAARPQSANPLAHGFLIAALTLVGGALVAYLGWIGLQIHIQAQQIATLTAISAPQIVKDASLHPEDPRSAKQVTQAMKAVLERGTELTPHLFSMRDQSSSMRPERILKHGAPRSNS